MKIICLIVIFFLIGSCTMVYAQAPYWQWARGARGGSTVSAVCSDHSGNAYITGYFLGELAFGSDSVYDNLGPYQDVFIAKYDAQGNALWATNGTGYADVYGISADGAGNVYVAGDFYNDSIAFGSYVLVDPTPGPQVSNIFLVKYDSLGQVLWAKNLGGINNDQATGVGTDAAGNVFVTGVFSGDSLTLDNITIQHLGSIDAFVAKFNSAGQTQWINSVGSPYSDGSIGLCTDMYGNVFMAGYVLGNYFFAGNINNVIASPYYNNVFITKYDSAGGLRWIEYAGGNYANSAAGISADTSGNVYLSGYFNDTIAFYTDTLAGPGPQNIFTAKYDTSGTVLWAVANPGFSAAQPTGIATTASGDSYVTGYFQTDTFYFDGAALLNPSGVQTTFVVKYDSYGNAAGAVAPLGASYNAGVGISCSNNDVYVTGTFQNAAIIFGNDTLPASDAIFLAKLDTALITGIAPAPVAASSMLAYPNPSDGVFYLRGIAVGDLVEVYDMMGRCLYAATADGDNYLVTLATVPGGVYLYKVSERNGITLGNGKIVIQ
jgi:hypothetical protein